MHVVFHLRVRRSKWVKVSVTSSTGLSSPHCLIASACCFPPQGQTLEVGQGQCDFIYRAAATMLCQEDEECVLEAEIFLNTMKLKHRFVPYQQRICRSRCTAQFLSIV